MKKLALLISLFLASQPLLAAAPESTSPIMAAGDMDTGGNEIKLESILKQLGLPNPGGVQIPGYPVRMWLADALYKTRVSVTEKCIPRTDHPDVDYCETGIFSKIKNHDGTFDERKIQYNYDRKQKKVVNSRFSVENPRLRSVNSSLTAIHAFIHNMGLLSMPSKGGEHRAFPAAKWFSEVLLGHSEVSLDETCDAEVLPESDQTHTCEIKIDGHSVNGNREKSYKIQLSFVFKDNYSGPTPRLPEVIFFNVK